MERTKIDFKTTSGKIISEVVDGVLSKNSAAAKYNTPLFKVFGVSPETVGTLSNDRACQIIANEGIGYAVQHYINATEFSDIETARLWNEADIALDNLEAHLNFGEWMENND